VITRQVDLSFSAIGLVTGHTVTIENGLDVTGKIQDFWHVADWLNLMRG